MKRPLRAFFFDVDDTLYSTTEFSQAARRNAVQSMLDAGLKMAPDDCLNELNEVISEFGSNNPSHFNKLLQRIPQECYDDASPMLIVAAGMVGYHQTKFRALSAYDDALEVLRILRERGLHLGIITAGVGIKQAEKIIRLGLHHLIPSKNIYITELLGISKTNTKIYARACKEAGAEPTECAYAGDNPGVDIDVPHRLGMRTFLSRRSGKYSEVVGEEQPDHVIHNFWDLLDVIDEQYEIISSK